MKKHKGGSEPSDQTLYNNDIEAIPLIIDNNSIDESELDDLEFELADNSFASHTPDTTINNSYDGETTKEDISDDEDDEDEEPDDVLDPMALARERYYQWKQSERYHAWLQQRARAAEDAEPQSID